MRSHSDIIAEIGQTELARLLDKPVSTTGSWRQRNSIPPEYWQTLIDGGLATAEELIAAAAAKAA